MFIDGLFNNIMVLRPVSLFIIFFRSKNARSPTIFSSYYWHHPSLLSSMPHCYSMNHFPNDANSFYTTSLTQHRKNFLLFIAVVSIIKTFGNSKFFTIFIESVCHSQTHRQAYRKYKPRIRWMSNLLGIGSCRNWSGNGIDWQWYSRILAVLGMIDEIYQRYQSTQNKSRRRTCVELSTVARVSFGTKRKTACTRRRPSGVSYGGLSKPCSNVAYTRSPNAETISSEALASTNKPLAINAARP